MHGLAVQKVRDANHSCEKGKCMGFFETVLRPANEVRKYLAGSRKL